MQRGIPAAEDAYDKAISVSTYKKQFNTVADAINKAVDNGELCCKVFLSSIMDRKLRVALDTLGYSIYPIERTDSLIPSIYTISWTAKELERNK